MANAPRRRSAGKPEAIGAGESSGTLSGVPGPGTAAGSPHYSIVRTAPAQLLRHDISDEELQVFVDMKRDYIWELKWVLLGLAIASFPLAIQSYVAFWRDGMPISGEGLFSIVLTVASASMFILLLLVMRSKTATAEQLAESIRARTANSVGG